MLTAISHSNIYECNAKIRCEYPLNLWIFILNCGLVGMFLQCLIVADITPRHHLNASRKLFAVIFYLLPIYGLSLFGWLITGTVWIAIAI